MSPATGKYADFEGLREQAVALRREGLSRRQIRDRLHVDNNDLLNRLLEGEPPPEWTKRPNAKDDLRERVVFVNSDAGMIRVFVAWLDLLDIEVERRRYHVMIHETGNAPDAERHWAEAVGASPSAFGKTSTKRHNPRTNRQNVGTGYHGCLAIRILGSADLYRRIEGAWCGIVGAVPILPTGIRT
ncbi:hypothetical protein AB0G79_23155 [Streptomyces sp. NPDC020807]|uniref:hypothetical protein n=1 Tax=Streptomyces sp. NPDC020807 TaxID=3155119 RepID=UPI0033E386E1